MALLFRFVLKIGLVFALCSALALRLFIVLTLRLFSKAFALGFYISRADKTVGTKADKVGAAALFKSLF